MKKKSLIFSLFSLFFLCCVFSNSNNASSVEILKLDNNIPVYIKNLKNSKVCSVNIVVKGGVRYLTPEQSGLEKALFTMMTKGSKFYPYQNIQSFFYKKQGSFSSSTSRYGSTLSITCLNKYFDETFDRFADGFNNPSCGAKEYDLLIQDYNQEVQYTLNDPDNMLFYYANQMIYSEHPYAVSSSVTPDSIQNITIDELKKLHAKILDSRRISIVACGAFDSKELVAKLNSAFGKIKPQNYEIKEEKIPPVKINGKPVVLVNPDAKNSGYLLRCFTSPDIHNEDYAASLLIENIYSNILYNVVREKNGICYTPSTFVVSSDAPFGAEYLYRTSNLKDFNKALKEARDIMSQGKTISGRDKNGEYIFDSLDNSLHGYKNTYINRKYSSQATVGGQASRMCGGILQFDDITASEKITAAVKNVLVQDIERVFEKYWLSSEEQWFCVIAPEEESEIRF